MQLYQQLGRFKQTTKQSFEENVDIPTKTTLYIHKLGFKNVQIKIEDSFKLMHGYSIRQVQVTQYSNNLGTSEKAVAKVKYPGEIILTMIEDFNKTLGEEILEYVDSISNEMRKWCKTPIKNIFQVQEKSVQSFGYKNAFIKIVPLLRYFDRQYYFEYERWIADQECEQQLLEIEKSQKVEGSSNYAAMFELIYKQIYEQRRVRLQKIEMKKAKQLQERMRKQEQQRKINQERMLKQLKKEQERLERQRRQGEYKREKKRREDDGRKQRELFANMERRKVEKRKQQMRQLFEFD